VVEDDPISVVHDLGLIAELHRALPNRCLSVAAAREQELLPPVWDTARNQQESR